MLHPHIGSVISLSVFTEQRVKHGRQIIKGIYGGKGVRAGRKEVRRERLIESQGERWRLGERTEDRQ